MGKGKSLNEMFKEARKSPMYWAEYLNIEIQNKVWNSRVLKDHRRHICKIVDDSTDKISKMAYGASENRRKEVKDEG